MPACSRNRTCLRMPALINIGNNTLDFKVRVRIGWISEDHKKEKLRFVSGGFPKSEKRRSRFVVLPGQSFEE
ncbi:unnamed protein product [Rhizophagus irregularis]|nr:unnamed protein product [Rhizophagus irregularis]CAB5371694.1 unnamed protein product [Rhizophagus irregularis]